MAVMAEVLAESERVETERLTERERDALRATSQDLLRTVRACVSHVSGAVSGKVNGERVRLSPDERDALVSTVALAVMESHRAQHGREPLTRGSYGRNYVLSLVRGAIRDRSYRDTLDGWRTRSAVRADDAPLIAGSVDSLPADGDGDETERPTNGWLSHALTRESERTGEPLSPVAADAPALCGEVARILRDSLALTPRESGSVFVALTVAAGTSLSSLAAEPGTPSLRTLAGRSADGARILRERVPPRDLASAVRDAARRTVADYALRAAMRDGARVSELAACALAAIDSAARTYRRAPSGPLPGPRSRVLCFRAPVRPIYGCVPPGPNVRPAEPVREWWRSPLPAMRNAYGDSLPAVLAPVTLPACPLCHSPHPHLPAGLHPSPRSAWPDSLTAGMSTYRRAVAATHGPRTSG